jgi:hypothetical protein
LFLPLGSPKAAMNQPDSGNPNRPNHCLKEGKKAER